MRWRRDVMRFGVIGGLAGLMMMVHPREHMAAESFVVYRGPQAQLPVSFEYPKEWTAEFSSGSFERYAQVQIYAPDSLEGRLRAYLVVRALPPKVEGGKYENLSEMVETYRATLVPNLRITDERQTEVLGAQATFLELAGTLRLHWEVATEDKEVPVQGQRVFFERHGQLYELAWMTTPEASATVEQAFAHLLTTLEITRR